MIGSNGNVYISGIAGDVNSNSVNMVTIKYNPSGVQQWINYLDGGLSPE
ncbi:MAG: hypothetical protein IPG99_15990 [Ignavibacteria bacterium]|nr:hypothetical protein [Ignavibacteria bacterium]